MSVQCPDGYQPDPTNALPSKPDDSLNSDHSDNTYVRTKYEFERAHNMPDQAVGCGQKGNFGMTYGIYDGGEINVTPLGLGGSVNAGEVSQPSVTITVESEEYEYVGIAVVLKKTTERGDFTTSGGFAGGGFWSKVKLAWRVLRHGAAALIPTVTYDDPDETEEEYLWAAWLICRKPCG